MEYTELFVTVVFGVVVSLLFVIISEVKLETAYEKLVDEFYRPQFHQR